MKGKKTYNNATCIKLENRSVLVGKHQNGFGFVFRVCDGSLEKRTMHRELKNKAVETYLNMSNEAAVALYFCLKEQIEKNHKELKHVL